MPFGYDPQRGWLWRNPDGSEVPASSAPDAIDAAAGRLLEAYKGAPPTTVEELTTLVTAARAQAQAMLQTGQVGAPAGAGGVVGGAGAIPPRPPGFLGPDWPIMTKPVLANPEGNAANGFQPIPAQPSVEDWAAMRAALNSLGLAYTQDPNTGQWAYTREDTLAREEPPPDVQPSARYGSYEDALAAAPAGWEPTVQGGWWTLQPAEEAKTKPPLSLDDTIDEFILGGRVDEAAKLWQVQQQVKGGGRLTRQQAATMVFNALDDLGDITPEQFKSWIDAIAGPEPTPAANIWGSPQLDAQAKARGEVFGQTGGGFQGPTGPFGVPIMPGMGTGLATPAQATAAGQGPFVPPGIGPEQFDPGFEGASPEVQAQIAAEMERRRQISMQAGVYGEMPSAPSTAPVFQAPTVTPQPGAFGSTTGGPITRDIFATNPTQVYTNTPAPGQQTNQVTPPPTPSQPDQGQWTVTPSLLAQARARGETSLFGMPLSVAATKVDPSTPPWFTPAMRTWIPEAQGVFQAPTVTPQQQVLDPFEKALFEINQANQRKRKQRAFQATPLPTVTYR